MIFLDNQVGSSGETAQLFAMSADAEYKNEIKIPIVLIFYKESVKLMNEYIKYPNLIVRLSEKVGNPCKFLFERFIIKFFFISMDI